MSLSSKFQSQLMAGAPSSTNPFNQFGGRVNDKYFVQSSTSNRRRNVKIVGAVRGFLNVKIWLVKLVVDACPGHPSLQLKATCTDCIGGFVQATSVKEMSKQMRDMRSQMEEDEDLKVLMASLRGQNLSDADFADENVQMRLVVVDEDGEGLPLEYDPEVIAEYWGRRPVALVSRVIQLLGIAGGFLGGLVTDYLTGSIETNQVNRAIELRNIMTSLGPAYIKLGQALSIRPDLLSPAAMNEMQKLCDKVPSFDSKVAMKQLEQELGAPWQEIYAELTPEPIAAASLGQVYKGKLKTGEDVAVKVQRPGVLETVTVDLYIIRQIGLALRNFPDITARADIVALLDEWAARFFEELDYVREGNNATRFANYIREDLPQVVVPKTYEEYTSRRVLTTEWLEGEKLSQSQADDVGNLVNIGVICYLKQLLDTGFFHAVRI